MFAGMQGTSIQPKRAIVTGGAGFVGSHLADRLLGEGAEVLAIDDLSTGKADRLAGPAELDVLDVADFDALEPVVAKFKPDTIFHLAAQASVTVSVSDPWLDEAVNVRGTLNVAEAARRAGAPIVFSSTGGALYGSDAPRPTSEDEPAVPLSPYGASKLAGESYLRAWAASSESPHTICRLGNVYGPRQSPHGEAGVVAIFSHKIWSGEPPTLFGDGAPTRDYVYVEDVTDALVKAAGSGGVFNIATGIETPVSRIFELVREAAGSDAEPVLAPLRPGELQSSGLDSSRAAAELGWNASVALDQGIARTYDALRAEFEAAAQV
jgi:UDP-glucose 4-epimerase